MKNEGGVKRYKTKQGIKPIKPSFIIGDNYDKSNGCETPTIFIQSIIIKVRKHVHKDNSIYDSLL